MLKLYFTLLITILGSIQLTSADCPDRYLYCFNSMEELLGEILVNQCWHWLLLSCQPCSVSFDQRKINYEKYIYQCQYYYPESRKVLARDNANFDRFMSQRRLYG
jgi:hypothetical protein